MRDLDHMNGARMNVDFDPSRLKLLSFDVFGTLISVRDSSYAAFECILRESDAAHVDVRAFWEAWEERNIESYWGPYRPYKEICHDSLAATFEAFGIKGRPEAIGRYFDAFPKFELYPDVVDTLDRLSRRFKLAIVSNIDDDLLAATPLKRTFDLVCTAERANGYKPDGTLFRYLLKNADVPREAILHSGQSQFTDMVGAKPLGLTVAWINRRGIALSPKVPHPDFEFANIQSLVPLVMPGK
jgi:2-haloalkanoic acid dehalogenase type II